MAQCIATSRRSGQRCKRPALVGATVCSKHGGSAPQVKAAAARRVEAMKATAALARIGARVEGDPIVLLLDVIAYQAGLVAYWRGRVEQIAEGDLTWGTTYVLLDEAQAKLVRYCAEALKAGMAERQVRLAEQQGALMDVLLRGVLARMLDVVVETLARLGVGRDEIAAGVREAWAAAVVDVVPGEIRRAMSERGVGA